MEVWLGKVVRVSSSFDLKPFGIQKAIAQLKVIAIANQFKIRADGSNKGKTWDFSDLNLLSMVVLEMILLQGTKALIALSSTAPMMELTP